MEFTQEELGLMSKVIDRRLFVIECELGLNLEYSRYYRRNLSEHTKMVLTREHEQLTELLLKIQRCKDV